MKKFLLIVNTTVLLFLFSSVLLPPKIKAQNQSVLAAQTQSNSTPITLLRDLLKILFSFDTGQSPPPASQPQPPPPQNPLTPVINPTITTSLPLPTSPLNPPPPNNQPPVTRGNVYYPQCSGSYDNYPLPGGCTVCKAGCGPTTVAMILASYVDKKITPKTVVDYYKNHNYYLGCSGSRPQDAYTILNSYGVKTTPIFEFQAVTFDKLVNHSIIRGYANSGWTFFALANFCQGGCGHYFWITDLGKDIKAYDSYYGRREQPPISENRYYPFPHYRLVFGVRK